MSLNNIEEISFCIHQDAPKIHCLTNPVTMQDVANLLLAAGGSAVMGQDEQEVEEITSFCHGTLLNTGVPDIAKIQACILAGQKANVLGHPVVLDPVGAGASTFRRKELQKLLQAVHPTAVRCNQEEAVVLCSLLSDTDSPEKHGGVESSLQMAERDVCLIAGQAASLLNCTVLITGKEDVVSDGKQTQILTGGDSRIRRITFLHSAHYFCVRTLLHLMRSVPPEHSGVKLPLKRADEQTQKNPALEVFMYIFLMYWKRN